MTLRKLTSPQKILFSLIINILVFGGIFALNFFGVSINTVLLLLALVISIEVIYLSFFIQMSVNNNTQSIRNIEEHIENTRQEEERIYTSLIYTGHQLKTLQHEVNALRKGHVLKTNGHSHHPKAHA